MVFTTKTLSLLDYFYGNDIKKYGTRTDIFSIIIGEQQIDFCSCHGMIGRLSNNYFLNYVDTYRNPLSYGSIRVMDKKYKKKLKLYEVFDLYEMYNDNDYEPDSIKWQFKEKTHSLNIIDDFFAQNIEYNPQNYPLSKKAKIKAINLMLSNAIKKDICYKYILLKQMVYGDIAKFITKRIYSLSIKYQ